MLSPIRITADDFGLAPEINAAVVDLAQKRRISAVSVMCHAEARHEHLQALLDTGVKVGLHLVLVEESSHQGNIMPRSYRELFAAVLNPRIDTSWIEGEVTAQLNKFKNLSINGDFINSHQHVHLFPPIWQRIRSMVLGSHLPIRVAGWEGLTSPKQAATFMSSRLCLSRELPLPVATVQAHGIGRAGKLCRESLERLLRRIARHSGKSAEIKEIVVHPGETPGTKDYSHWRYRWQQELELLSHPDLPAIFEAHGFTVA